MNQDIFLYTLSTCSHCKDAKKFFEDRGLEYETVDVDLLQGEERQEALAEVKKYNPRLSFPTIVIGGAAFVGFKKDKIKNHLAGMASETNT